MKIALVNNYYYLRGGSERVLFDDRDALTSAGHEVQPFCPQDERNEPASSSSYFPVLIDYTKAQGAAAFEAAWNIVYSRAARCSFAAFLDSFRPDLIHGHNIYGRLTTAVLDEACKRRIPAVLTVHDLKLACPAYLGLREGQPCLRCADGRYWRCLRYKCHKQSYPASFVYMIEAYFNRYAGKYGAVARFLCPSRFMQKVLIDSGIDPKRIIYHPNALDPARYDPCYVPGEYMLYAGRLSSEKGITTLLESVRRTRISLRIAGTGPLEVALRNQIAEHKLPVQMEGYCSGERLASLYRGAAFVVVPSEWYENASMSVLESFAYGKPALASRIGGNPELVKEGESGCLFLPGSADELASAARSMWENRDDLARMGKLARLRIEKYFAQGARLSSLIEIYRIVCNSQTSV